MRLSDQKAISSSRARRIAIVVLFFAVLIGIFDAPHYWNSLMARFNAKTGTTGFSYLTLRGPIAPPFRLGLDIQGGAHLVYQADLENLAGGDATQSMDAVRDIIERRVNLFGVAEPLVQVERSGSQWRLIVELAGIKDIRAAIRLIGATPFLEFKEERSPEDRDIIFNDQKNDGPRKLEDPNFKATGLTGRFVKGAQVSFDQTTFRPLINLELTDEGGTLFADLTARNIGKQIAIYLDGAPISAPVVQEAIIGGKAQISGTFTPATAKELS